MPKDLAAPSQRRRPKRVSEVATTLEVDDGPYHSRTISRALDVLEAFSEEHPALTLKDPEPCHWVSGLFPFSCARDATKPRLSAAKR